MTKKIKYDGSEQEMLELGLITEDGQTVTALRNEFNLYMKECDRRRKYRNDKELIELGIVDKDGAVLDEARLHEIESARLEQEYNPAQRREEERLNAERKPGILKKAMSKVFAKLVPHRGTDLNR